MIDTALYHQLHPDLPSISRVRKKTQHDSQDEDPETSIDLSFLLLLPPTLYGYDMREHRWIELLVANISPVLWNKRSFDHLVLPAPDKDLIRAMALSQSRDSSQNAAGTGRFLLLHGGPGTGKTLIAEVIAETIERPLFRMSLSNIGTDPTVAQQNLRTVAVMCNTWNCVVLLDGADIFLEERRPDSMGRNVMGVAIMEALDAFTCMMIFTTDRVGTFDETFRSRCQLAVYLERPDYATREKIWSILIERGPCETRSGDLIEKVENFAKWELNGMQIRNAIIMATQLAHAKEERLSVEHVYLVLDSSKKFEKYLTKLHTMPDDEIARGNDLI